MTPSMALKYSSRGFTRKLALNLLMKRILFFLLFLLLVQFSFAGTISGVVKDEKGNVLPYASITVKGTSKGAITNAEGKYSIQLVAGNYTLICQYVGFKKRREDDFRW